MLNPKVMGNDIMDEFSIIMQINTGGKCADSLFG